MRAGVLYAPGDLRVEHRPDPRADDFDVVIKVAFNGLCGTDATEYSKGPMMVPLLERHPGSGHIGPTILGHEFVGTVVESGSGARDWLGRRVACGAGVSCGECRWCGRGRTNLCASYYTLGLSTDGGLAEFVAAPSASVVAVPPECTDLDAALAQPLAVALHGIDRVELAAGDRVVILGAGAIGSFILAGLGGHEGPVIVLDVDPGRLESAAALGATAVHLVDRASSLDDLRDLVPGPIDVVIESSGAPGAAANAVGLVSRGGRVLLVGLVKEPQEITLADLVLREVDVRTTVAHVCAVDLPRALSLLARRPLAGALGVTKVPLSAVVSQGLDPLVAGTVAGKVLVDPRHG